MATRNGTPGNDTLTGTQFADSLFGFAGNDSLLGLGGSDRLEGGIGNDTLNGGIGIDTLIGGAGKDTYIVDRTTDSIIEAARSGEDTVLSSVSYTLGDNLDNLTLTGTGAINGTGNSLNNTITGNAANNTLYGEDGQDTLYGGDGNDTLFGGGGGGYSSGDLLDGGNGDDNLSGGGDDILIGGDGNDTLKAGYGGYQGNAYGNSILDGGDGNDILYSSNHSEMRLNDFSESADSLRGGNGEDTLYGGEANNTLEGGNGNDTYITFGIDTILEAGNAGIDTVQSSGNYTLADNLENLILTGTSSINGTGNTLNNKIIGNAANNFIQAVSFGVVGERDTLTGGAGKDAFLLGDATQVFYDDRNKATAGSSDYALITDFNTGEDAIKLNGNRNNYRLATSPAGLPGGTAIYRNKPAGEPDELIGIVQGISGLNLNGNYFRFTADEINPSALNGRNGFTINSNDAGDRLGFSVSDAGDVNGDGFDDLIIGAPEPYVPNATGESYVVFGKATGFSPNLNLSTLNGTNGFVINGVDVGDRLGFSVSGAGDVNADGFSDLIISTSSYGESYVVFGKATGFSPSLNLSALDGTNGFQINSAGYDFADGSVSGAGDINGDGFDDLILGNPPYGDDSYVVFGKATGFSPSLSLSALDGTNGFQMNAYELGYSVSGAGDVNGDGFDDLVIGASIDERGSPYYSSTQIYVVFGKATGFSSSFDISALDGTNGFEIEVSNKEFVNLGTSVSNAGDINGDGFDDLVIGGASQTEHFYSEPLGPNRGYVVFGKAEGFGASIDVSTLNGSNGFVVEDINEIGSSSGFKVSSAGDVNADGFDDFMVGASNAGATYVVFGKATGFDASLNVFDINGRNGFVINGVDANDYSGFSVSSAGDVNGDGFDDLTVGAPFADYSYSQNNAGESYVIFGRDFTGSVTNTGTAGNDTLTGTAGDDILVGGRGNDRLIGGLGINVLYGGAGDDILSFGAIDRRINGGSGTDTLRIDTSGINMNLRAIANNKITEFELIDLTGTGNNSLNFTRLDLLDLSDTTNQLIVNGNTGDTATSTGQGWTPGGTTTLNGILYGRYTVGAATLLVDTDITQTIT